MSASYSVSAHYFFQIFLPFLKNISFKILHLCSLKNQIVLQRWLKKNNNRSCLLVYISPTQRELISFSFFFCYLICMCLNNMLYCYLLIPSCRHYYSSFLRENEALTIFSLCQTYMHTFYPQHTFSELLYIYFVESSLYCFCLYEFTKAMK